MPDPHAHEENSNDVTRFVIPDDAVTVHRLGDQTIVAPTRSMHENAMARDAHHGDDPWANHQHSEEPAPEPAPGVPDVTVGAHVHVAPAYRANGARSDPDGWALGVYGDRAAIAFPTGWGAPLPQFIRENRGTLDEDAALRVMVDHDLSTIQWVPLTALDVIDEDEDDEDDERPPMPLDTVILRRPEQPPGTYTGMHALDSRDFNRVGIVLSAPERYGSVFIHRPLSGGHTNWDARRLDIVMRAADEGWCEELPVRLRRIADHVTRNGNGLYEDAYDVDDD